MSDDDLEKLAAAMQNIKPSDDARLRGMDAAMAAFDMEFAAETVQDTVKTTSLEKNIETAQGLSAAPRPTGQSTGTKSVQTLWSGTMSKLDEFFTFTPKTATIMGSCAAALIASFIYVESNPSVSYTHLTLPTIYSV